MIKGLKVCQEHKLDRLLIPPATILSIPYEGKTLQILVQQTVELMPEESYYDTIAGFEETVRQLALFIVKTGFSDVDFRNIPITKMDLLRIALIDLDTMDGARYGIFGGSVFGGGRGLVRCLFSEALLDAVIACAHEHNVKFPSIPIEAIKKHQLELKRNRS